MKTPGEWASHFKLKQVDKTTLAFLFEHSDESMDFFWNAVNEETLNLESLGQVTRALNLGTYVAVVGAQHRNDDALIYEAGSQYIAQFKDNWWVNPNITFSDGFKSDHCPWTNHRGAKSSIQYRYQKPEDYLEASLKLINCLTEFYYGDPLFPNVTHHRNPTPR